MVGYSNSYSYDPNHLKTEQLEIPSKLQPFCSDFEWFWSFGQNVRHFVQNGTPLKHWTPLENQTEGYHWNGHFKSSDACDDAFDDCDNAYEDACKNWDELPELSASSSSESWADNFDRVLLVLESFFLNCSIWNQNVSSILDIQWGSKYSSEWFSNGKYASGWSRDHSKTGRFCPVFGSVSKFIPMNCDLNTGLVFEW